MTASQFAKRGAAVAAVSAIFVMAGAVWKPNVGAALFLYGVLLLPVAFIAALAGFYLEGAGIPVSSGATVTPASNPIAYKLWFIAAFAAAAFLGYIVVGAM